jgi:hypothetical protein
VVREKTFPGLVRRNRAGEVRQRQRCLSLCKLASACTSRAAAGERTGAQRPGRSRNARTRELADSGFSDWTAAPRMKPAEVGVHTLLRPAHHTTRVQMRSPFTLSPSLLRSRSVLQFKVVRLAERALIAPQTQCNACFCSAAGGAWSGEVACIARSSTSLSSPQEATKRQFDDPCHSHPSQPSPVA